MAVLISSLQAETAYGRTYADVVRLYNVWISSLTYSYIILFLKIPTGKCVRERDGNVCRFTIFTRPCARTACNKFWSKIKHEKGVDSNSSGVLQINLCVYKRMAISRRLSSDLLAGERLFGKVH